MMQTKRISDDLRLVFHFDPKNPDMYCFVLEDTIYGNEIIAKNPICAINDRKYREIIAKTQSSYRGRRALDSLALGS